jgi:3'-5' exoribonuclease
MVAELASRMDGGMPRDKLLALAHCILTHHGPDGVPSRRFASPEALALHRINSLDAAVKGALEHGLAA